MLLLGRVRLVFDLLAVPSLRRPRPCFSLHFHSANRWTLRRTFSIKTPPRNDFFEFTSGRWIINEALRLEERRRVFNVDGLRRLAAESVGRSADDIADMRKLAEGGYNRIFLITMHDGFKMVARIPYPVTVPKYFVIASEVATMDFLHSSGLPIPKVYGYSPSPDNAADTEYIFMEFVEGTILMDVWSDLGREDIISITCQLAELESKMMSIAFPAGGSLYYAQDLEKVVGKPGIPLEDKRFCVGPDVRLPLWQGRRSQLDVDRGPYKTTKAALVRGAEKELVYLQQFGQPLLPFHRLRREAYQYQEQPPSDHVENLDRYLRIALSLVPSNPAIVHFRIRHPDLQPSNIIVSKSPDSRLHVVRLIDWQHTSILPLFLLANVPKQLHNYDDPAWQYMTQPSLPDNLDDLDEAEQKQEKECYRRRLVHYHYVKNTEKYNKPHYAALMNPMGAFLRPLFHLASDPWKGETLALKVALIEAAENWKVLTREDSTCPVVFDPEDVDETMKLDEEQREADKLLESSQNMVGFRRGGWVSAEWYEEAMVRSKWLKEQTLTMSGNSEITAAHWHLDDMDESEYM